ncbi:hypothetical protein FRB99_007198 [Tulasnella sp. 403]|nr:hypothetical protein FRB99_007198 [Tulasnella sp. 403]
MPMYAFPTNKPYKVLSGKLPFHDIREDMAVYAVVKDENRRPPKEPDSRNGQSYEELWNIAERCWQKDPTQRPSMQTVFDDISEARRHLPDVIEHAPVLDDTASISTTWWQRILSSTTLFRGTTVSQPAQNRLSIRTEPIGLAGTNRPPIISEATDVYLWGDTGQGRLGVEKVPDSYPVGVPFPIKLDIKGRITSLAAGGWYVMLVVVLLDAEILLWIRSFHALDDEGNIRVWGQLNGPFSAGEGFADASKRAETPHRLNVLYPALSPRTEGAATSRVIFTSISCGRACAIALDSHSNVWIFPTWGRPILLVSSLISSGRPASASKSLSRKVVQVEAGWGFVAMLTEAGKALIMWPDGEDSTFKRLLSARTAEIDRIGSNSTRGRASTVRDEKVIQCTAIPIEFDPIRLPSIPASALPLLDPTLGLADTVTATTARSRRRGSDAKLTCLAGGDHFLIGLTNRGHVLSIDVSQGEGAFTRTRTILPAKTQQPSWEYMPEFSDMDRIRQDPAFDVHDGVVLRRPPRSTRITNIYAHLERFVAYAVPSSNDEPSLVLVGTKTTPNGILSFPSTVVTSLLEKSIKSVSLGDYHAVALSTSGQLMSWGQYSNGALGLGDPASLPVGAPGGHTTEEAKASQNRITPPDVNEPAEVQFGSSDEEEQPVVVLAAAGGWHTAALVVNRKSNVRESQMALEPPGLKDRPVAATQIAESSSRNSHHPVRTPHHSLFPFVIFNARHGELYLNKTINGTTRGKPRKNRIEFEGRYPTTITGTFCDVYKATMLPEGKTVAVKRFRVANSDEKEEMIQNIELASQAWVPLHHRSLLQFIGTARDQAGALFLVSDWADKGSLWDIVTKPDPTQQPVDSKYLTWLRETADALAYLHENHIIHGDVKARNILISESGNALLCDFGLIKHVASGFSVGTKALGTVRWQSPEMWDGASRSEKTDVYAFGITVYEVLSGKIPYANLKSSLALVNAVLVRDERPPTDPQISRTGVVFEPLWDVARDCWRTAAVDRPVMSAVCDRLHAIRELHVVPVVPVVPEPEAPIVEPPRKQKSNRLRVRFPAEAGDLSGQIRKRGTAPAGSNYYSDVFEGELTQTSTRVAIHVLRILDGPNLDDASGDRREQVEKWLTREFASWMALRHPRIVAVLGYALLDDMPCLVYEWCPLVEVLDWLKRNPKADRRRLVFGVADGLQYLHSLQIPVVHGGIKPMNILVDEQGGARISAIGINRWLDDGPGTTTVDRKMFTVRYAAPELLNGTLDEPSVHCDVYSFACVALAIMTGKQPFFSSKNESDVTLAIAKSKSPASGDYQELPSRDPLWPILEECWRTEPNQRPSMQGVPPVIGKDGSDHSAANLSWRGSGNLKVVSQNVRGLTHWFVSLVVRLSSGKMVSVTFDKPEYMSADCDIFIARDRNDNKIALKRLRVDAHGYTPEQTQHIRREESIWQTLDHANILQFLGTGDIQGTLFLASPWIENGSLSHYISKNPGCDRPALLRETASALVYLHERNIIHGDVKASNVLVSNEVHAVMCDFGLSRPTAAQTAPGLKGAGTLRWQSPELWDNSPKSFKSDVYAFGIMIYEVLSGKEPFHHCKGHANLLTAIIQKNERPPRQPETSPSGENWSYLWDIAERCWAKEPTARPTMHLVLRWLNERTTSVTPTASEADLQGVTAQDDVAGEGPSPPSRSRSPPRERATSPIVASPSPKPDEVPHPTNGHSPNHPSSAGATKGTAVEAEPLPPPAELQPATTLTASERNHQVAPQPSLNFLYFDTSFATIIVEWIMGNCISAKPPSNLYLEVAPEGRIRFVNLSSLVAKYTGGSGDILMGEDDTGTTVAVKRLRVAAGGYTTEQAEHMQAEATVWRQLDHSNVLQFLGTALFEGNLCLISPWMNNGSLRDYLPKHPDADRPQFLLETANALVYLHSKSIIHGDVKAANILVSSDTPPRALMCDFGLSRPTVIPTAKGLKGAGTAKWQAPELWDNQPKSFRSDVFSFGITIFEVLSGNEPYCDCSPATLLVQVSKKDKRPTKEPLQCPRTGNDWRYLWDVAEKCWKTELTERPQMGSVHRWLDMKKMDGTEVDVAEQTPSAPMPSGSGLLKPPPSSMPIYLHTVTEDRTTAPAENPVVALSVTPPTDLPRTPEVGTLSLVAPEPPASSMVPVAAC